MEGPAAPAENGSVVAVDESTQALEQETDPLTGFGTRSVLMRDLEGAVAPGSPTRMLAVVDLRSLIDLQGRIRGDEHLRSLAGHLTEALRGARFYRPREDELAVLVEGPPADAEQRLAAAVSTVNGRLGLHGVVVAFGGVTLPTEAGESLAALRIAESRDIVRRGRSRDRRLYPRGA
jgi:GGDEF domain-containing protein